MRRDLKDRKVLITGASGGIGKALALQLRQLGAKVAIAARSEEKLHSMQAQYPDILTVVADVTRNEDRKRILAEVEARFGGLDILVNNAGIGSWAHFADSTEEVMRQVMEVNFFAPTELMRAALPLLRKGSQPAIVNVSSMCGRKAMPGWSEYSASKFALCGLTEALRGEFARFDIDVLLIVPGLTRSDFNKHFLQAKGRANIEFEKGMTPEYVAAQIVRSIQTNRTETVLGSEAKRVLWCNLFFPRLTDWLLAREIRRLYPKAT